MSDSLHLVCPHCQAINRLPATRLQQNPKCGQCHQVLFNAHPVELTAISFGKHMAHNDIPVLIDFWAAWCKPCKMMAPAFVQAAQMLEPQVRLAKLNTEAEPQISNSYGIRSIPTLILFKGGHEVARQSGAMATPEIVRWVRNHF